MLFRLLGTILFVLVSTRPADTRLATTASISSMQVIGPLGFPLGQPLVVEGVLGAGRYKGRTESFLVKKLNGKVLRVPVKVLYHWWPPHRTKLASLATGRSYRFLAYQHAEISGTSYALMKAMNATPWQTHGTHLRIALVLMKQVKGTWRLPSKWRQRGTNKRKKISSTKLTHKKLVVSGLNQPLGKLVTVRGREKKCVRSMPWRLIFPSRRRIMTKGQPCFLIKQINGAKLARGIVLPLCGKQKKRKPYTKSVSLLASLEGGMINGPVIRQKKLLFSPRQYQFACCLFAIKKVKRKPRR